MKQLFILILMALLPAAILSQPTSISKGKIYAVIVGISDYADDDIKDLSFAHRDAEKFHEYLSSAAGGLVPESQMRLLTNENATISGIYTAMQWVQDEAKKDDMVFFYFSGHGDVESSLYKLGFLLAHDTPHKNYLNNAVRIEDLNIMANTLSVTKDVKVVLITDACHSGKLAGSDNRGTSLVGEQLSKVESSEIRIASCKSNQLSQEGEDWGQGRGVFSYYLINGLIGLADDKEDQDGYVTLLELEEYLKPRVRKAVFSKRQVDQVPVVKGEEFTMMAITNVEALALLKQPGASDQSPQDNPSNTNAKSVDRVMLPIDLYFKNLKNRNIKSDINFPEWGNKTAEEQMELFLAQYPIEGENNILNTELIENKGSKRDFQNRMAAAIHNSVQAAINAYLVGDREEMERRQYFNAHNNEFEEYEDMLNVAMNLIDSTNYLYKIFRVKKHYFKGVAIRLKMPISEDPMSLRELAMEQQQIALALEDQAAYIHNEIGILYKMEKQNEKAAFHYNKASELVPNWAIPIANLSGLNKTLGNYEKGVELAERALKIQPDYANAYLHLGGNVEKQGNLLFAEECYIKARDLNPQHYLSYQNLAYVYNSEFKFAKADIYYLEAYNRLMGINPLFLDQDMDGILDASDEMDLVTPCEIKKSKIGPEDAFAMLVYGMKYFSSDPDLAKEYLLKSVHVKKENPIAYKYLGELAFKKKDWIGAEIQFNLARDYFLERDEFEEYCVEEEKNQEYLECDIPKRFRSYYFNREILHFFQGENYNNLSYFEKAEGAYRDLLEKEQGSYFGMFLLAKQLESREKYSEVESILKLFVDHYKRDGNAELKAFYDRLVSKEIMVEHHTRNTALLLYDMIFGVNGEEYGDANTYRSNEGTFEIFSQDSMTTPGTGTRHATASWIFYPGNQASDYFKKLKQFENNLDEANLQIKMGDVAYYLGDVESSTKNYQKAFDLDKDNYSNILQLVDNRIERNEFTAAYAHLGELHKKDRVDFKHLELLAEYYTFSTEYKNADKTLNEAQRIYPFHLSTVDYSRARNAFFDLRVGDAVDGFREMLKEDESDADVNYALARVCASQGKNNFALKQLEKALDNGFAYAFVLDQDNLFDKLRSDKKWKELRNRLN